MCWNKPKYFLFIAVFAFLGQVGLCQEPPNIIIIMTDDQGYGDLSFHGNPVLKTPNIDELAQESVRFTDFHVAPMCTPTRSQLLTGLDAMRNGATAVCQGRSMVRNNVKMLPQYFQDRGYATGLFGKWHLGDSYPHRPIYRGFEEVVSFRAWGFTSLADYWGNSYFDPVLEHNGIDKKFHGYCTDIFFEEAMNFMNTCAERNKPFFVYLPTNTPHVPEIVSEEFSKPYDKEYKGKKLPADFYGMIANIDLNIGKLERFLSEKGLKDNTILVFLSDNGTQNSKAQDIYNFGMRAKKASVYEGGHRVPLFVRWVNGKLLHGKNVGELTQVQDILPTLLDLCGIETGSNFDGTSMSRLLKEQDAKLDNRMCVIQYRLSGEKWDPAVVLWNKWRLVNNKELYNIERDPGQKDNIINGHLDIVEQMRRHYDDWYEHVLPKFNGKRNIVIRSSSEEKTTLYASDWQGGYCDNRKGLVQANTNGYWDINIEEEGTYQIELRRWPEESRKMLTDSFDGDSMEGTIPVRYAQLTVGNFNQVKPTKTDDTYVAYTLDLDAGNTNLRTALLDTNKNEICGAMYVTIFKKD